jgi:two-component system OmpR family response regulator
LADILLLEDSAAEALLVVAALKTVGRVQVASDVAQARALAERTVFDLLILDISLPDSDGFKALGLIRSFATNATTPAFFLSGRSDLASKLAGFSLGAVDYVVKPFDPLELAARARARIQDRGREEWRWGNLIVRPLQGRAFVLHSGQEAESELKLTPMEFKILARMIQESDQTVSREALLDAIHGPDGRDSFDRAIDKHVSRLRKKLAPAQVGVEASSGLGYRLSSLKS